MTVRRETAWQVAMILGLCLLGFAAVTVGAGGPVEAATGHWFEVRRVEVDVRPGAAPITVHARIEAVAVDPADTLVLPYCGLDPVFVSVDGSTVAAEVDAGVLNAPLHTPIVPGQRFTLAILAGVEDRDGGSRRTESLGAGDVSHVLAQLFC